MNRYKPAQSEAMRRLCAVSLLLLAGSAGLLAQTSTSVQVPVVGTLTLQALTPTVLAITKITTAQADGTEVGWDASTPTATQFRVRQGQNTVRVLQLGWRRRVCYAPLNVRDLRIEHILYLQLATPMAAKSSLSVDNPDGHYWQTDRTLQVTLDDRRWSPLLHVNQVGFAPSWPKVAYVGGYLGTLGEAMLSDNLPFTVQDDATGRSVFTGFLHRHPDIGFQMADPPYQQVWEADFSACTHTGRFRICVPGLGCSYAFLIDEGCAATYARTYALGCYHQRCGASNALPFTRDTHAACHTEPAAIPTMSADFKEVNACLARMTAQPSGQHTQAAPRLQNVAASLYPFVKHGVVDVSGGHHDAGDYSKYTINSAQFIHYLTFAVDYLPGVASLDNLGIPESGDGVSDVLQLARWEADFLLKMQDDDGGFFFLVYPRTRAYEQNVLPDHGDAQVVFPKNTAATAAATAALAQLAASPTMQTAYPEAAARYLAAAKRGWAFLERAWAAYGRDGAYQKITHYGDLFADADEIVWAEAALFIATGEMHYQDLLVHDFDPADPKTRRWGWVRLSESYGAAIRCYAFAARAGRIPSAKINTAFAAACELQIMQLGEERITDSTNCAYGVSYPATSKRHRTAGWLFATDLAFDAVVADQLHPQPALEETVLRNLDYEVGANPVNMTFLTGLGWQRQHVIVHQYAENDRRALPPSGLPLGCLQQGYAAYAPYGTQLGKLSMPSDGDPANPYPLYDRWGDAFNTTTEFTIPVLARGLATTAYLMARSPLRTQSWCAAPATIILSRALCPGQPVTATLQAPTLDLAQSVIVWETQGCPPTFGATLTFTPTTSGPCWIEAEAQSPDGRRVFACYEGVVATDADMPKRTTRRQSPWSTAIAHLPHSVVQLTELGRRKAG